VASGEQLPAMEEDADPEALRWGPATSDGTADLGYEGFPCSSEPYGMEGVAKEAWGEDERRPVDAAWRARIDGAPEAPLAYFSQVWEALCAMTPTSLHHPLLPMAWHRCA
jgi:hypothetical protein